MKIKELYLLAKERGILDYEIQVQHGDEGGYYDGTRDIEIDIETETKTVVL